MYDAEILQKLKQPLKELNRIRNFPDLYKPAKVVELASEIEKEAEKIRRPEFDEIKRRLLEYAGRKELLDQNTRLKTLADLFQKKVDSDKYEPELLCEEIDRTVRLMINLS